jgi:hypothetical protein
MTDVFTIRKMFNDFSPSFSLDTMCLLVGRVMKVHAQAEGPRPRNEALRRITGDFIVQTAASSKYGSS